MKRFWLTVLLVTAGGVAGACGDDNPANDRAGQTATTPGASQPAKEVRAADRAGVNVTGQETVLTTSDALRQTLEQENVTLETLTPARSSGETISLPIDGGRVSVEDGGGTVNHEGAIVFRGGENDGRVEVSDLFVDTRSGTAYGLIGGSRVRFLNLDTSALELRREDDHVVLGELRARLAEDGAAVLQEELGAQIEAGQEVGTMSVRLLPTLPDAAGAPDADAAGRQALDELRQLQERARALAEEAQAELSPEARRRLDEAGEEIEKALGGS